MRIFLFTLFLFFPVSAGANSLCNKASSTADIMKCEAKRNQDAQGALKNQFDVVLRGRTGEALDTLKDVQGAWLEYRDAECAFEAAQIGEESLRRIEELRCLTRISQERMVALKKFDETPYGSPAEIAAQPRWMNALAEDYPDVFWRFGDVVTGDTDCDGESEFIMTGMRHEPLPKSAQAVIAITENPATGRPQNQILSFDLDLAEKANAELVSESGVSKTPRICSSHFSVVIETVETIESTESRACETRLKIEQPACDPLVFIYNEKGFMPYVPPTVAAEKDDTLARVQK